MRVLLDTHTFIWLLFEPQRLSTQALTLLSDSTTQLFVSIATLWEMMIKQQSGKLRLKRSLRSIIDEPNVASRIAWLPVTAHHILSLEELPLYHRDPFDRILVAQAVSEQLTLVSKDPLVQQYPVATLW